MNCEDESRTLRRRVQELEDALASGLEDIKVGSASLVGHTTELHDYPSVAQAYYACFPVRISGEIGEGIAPELTDGETAFYALNVGNAVPPEGSYFVITETGGRYTFDFRG